MPTFLATGGQNIIVLVMLHDITFFRFTASGAQGPTGPKMSFASHPHPRAVEKQCRGQSRRQNWGLLGATLAADKSHVEAPSESPM